MKSTTAFVASLLLAIVSVEAKPLKVFILAGQSIMEGAGQIKADLKRNGGKGSLEYLVKEAATAKRFASLVDSTAQWRVRDDVWISYLDRRGPLTVGFGARKETIGPELGFGWVMGDALQVPVLLIKCAWGGKSLAVDFRPPSAGKPPYSLGEKTDADLKDHPEILGEAISQGAINHALAYQKDPAMASYRGYMGYLMDGMKDQLNAQGAETFASGFLMGMFTQPIMTAPAWAITKGIEKIQNKDKLKEIKDQRDAAIKKQVDTLNEMDIQYWAPDLALAVKNGALSKHFSQAISIGNEKGARDTKFAMEFNHIGTAIQSGKFDDLMARLADYKNLSPQQALEAFAEAALAHGKGPQLKTHDSAPPPPRSRDRTAWALSPGA